MAPKFARPSPRFLLVVRNPPTIGLLSGLPPLPHLLSLPFAVHLHGPPALFLLLLSGSLLSLGPSPSLFSELTCVEEGKILDERLEGMQRCFARCQDNFGLDSFLEKDAESMDFANQIYFE